MSGWADHAAASPVKSIYVLMGTAYLCRSWSRPGNAVTQPRLGRYSMLFACPVLAGDAHANVQLACA
jgi:hypothetical protein